jgi:hypothetical protein
MTMHTPHNPTGYVLQKPYRPTLDTEQPHKFRVRVSVSEIPATLRETARTEDGVRNGLTTTYLSL